MSRSFRHLATVSPAERRLSLRLERLGQASPTPSATSMLGNPAAAPPSLISQPKVEPLEPLVKAKVQSDAEVAFDPFLRTKQPVVGNRT